MGMKPKLVQPLASICAATAGLVLGLGVGWGCGPSPEPAPETLLHTFTLNLRRPAFRDIDPTQVRVQLVTPEDPTPVPKTEEVYPYVVDGLYRLPEVERYPTVLRVAVFNGRGLRVTTWSEGRIEAPSQTQTSVSMGSVSQLGDPCIVQPGSLPCESGFCVDGVCCEERCQGSCQACNLGRPGTCEPVIDFGTDPDTCATPNACISPDLFAAKQPGGWQFCMGDDECQSRVCGQENVCLNLAVVANGNTCTRDGKCLSGMCLAQVCSQPEERPFGAPCAHHLQCVSRSCPVPTSSSSTPRVCGQVPNGSWCDRNTTCLSGTCDMGLKACVSR